MRGRLSAIVAMSAAVLSGGCELRDGDVVVTPGPAVPSPFPISGPYAWDTREELNVWVYNPVTRGPVAISLAGDGPDAVIRIEAKRGAADGWVLRGPDLTPPARHVRGLRLWYRWRPDPTLTPGASLTFWIAASFDAVNPPRPPEQPEAYVSLQPASERTEALFQPGSFRDSLDVNYLYLHQSSANAGVFEIDRIEIVQAQ